jgi:hypothetical protein
LFNFLILKGGSRAGGEFLLCCLFREIRSLIAAVVGGVKFPSDYNICSISLNFKTQSWHP